jgi:hypothetical protein
VAATRLRGGQASSTQVFPSKYRQHHSINITVLQELSSCFISSKIQKALFIL